MTNEPRWYPLESLAEHVGGHVFGDPQLRIEGIRPFESAEEGDLTLALEKQYRDQIGATRASAVIVPRDFSLGNKTLLQVENPKLAFAKLLALFHEKPFLAEGISSLAYIGHGCHIADKVTIHPFVYVGDEVEIGDGVTLFPGVCVGNGCVIGKDCRLYPNVVLYDGVSLGNRVILHGGTVIGADGYGYVFDGQRHFKISQGGTVVVQDDVEIGANSCVDRATFGDTLIEKGVKLDNHVHIAHNCTVGENTLMVAQVGLAGSVKVGKDCAFGGNAGVIEGVHIGDQARVMVKTLVTKNLASCREVSGNPAMDHRQRMKLEALTRRLPELYAEQQLRSRGKAAKKKKGRKTKS